MYYRGRNRVEKSVVRSGEKVRVCTTEEEIEKEKA